jgi:hypothetical protein
MHCADFMAGENLDNVLMHYMSRFFKFLPSNSTAGFPARSKWKAIRLGRPRLWLEPEPYSQLRKQVSAPGWLEVPSLWFENKSAGPLANTQSAGLGSPHKPDYPVLQLP